MEIIIRETQRHKYLFDTEERMYKHWAKDKDATEWECLKGTWTEQEWFELQAYISQKLENKKNRLSLEKGRLTRWENSLRNRERLLTAYEEKI